MLETKTQVAIPQLTLKSPVRYLKGVGPEKERVLGRLGVRTVGDLFGIFPRRYEKRFPVKRIGDLTFEEKECVVGVVASRGLIRWRGGRSVFKAVLRDGAQALFAVFYHQPYLTQVFKPKQQAVLYGTAEKKGKRIEMAHPEWELFDGVVPARTPHHGRWVPVYPLTEELGQKYLRQTLHAALAAHTESIPETLPADLRERAGLLDARTAYRQIHFPSSEASREGAYKRLVFEEFLCLGLFMERRRARLRQEREEVAHAADWRDVQGFLDSLPFTLTTGQKRACEEIVRDMQGKRAMNRLIQGDVGSGKTVVAATALFFTARSGFQGVLMAPTEVLAQQLYLNMVQLLEPFGIRVGYLSQSTEPAHREILYGALERGDIAVVVGTHALLDVKLRFKKLGLAVVDEQHKFGVEQRALLRKKQGVLSHFLMMTATPIPRTLAMTLYGDMDISEIVEKPKGRLPIRTLLFRSEHHRAVYRWLENVLEEGSQAFVVCPRVDVGGEKGAIAHAEELKKVFSRRKVALLHGRMKSAEKNAVMGVFKEGKADLLVTTVLIEVGVDVPNARFMLIENAEKFGLAQLHQLRGRIGRGSEESFCVLFSDSEEPETRQRLDAFAQTESGFEIAEKDLEQRGSGELHGQKQHGLLELRIGDLVRDAELLKRAKEEARSLIEKDPELSAPANRALRRLVQERFGRQKESLG